MRKDNKAFSLIELLVALSVSLIALFVIYDVFIVSRKNYILQEQLTDMNQRARASIEFITRQMRNLASITAIDCTEDNSSIVFESIADMGMVESATYSSITDNSKSWTLNQWRNDTLAIVDGTGSGQTRKISGNTSTVLIVASGWVTDPDNTSLYLIKSNMGFKRDQAQEELDFFSGGLSSPFAQDITSFTIKGFDPNDTASCDPNTVRKLDFSVTARASLKDSRKEDQYTTFTVKTTFTIRE